MYKEINFITEEVFKKDDVLSHWIINLALIRNDLLYSNEYAFNHFEREIELENGRFVNYFRIILSHYIEAMKFLAQSHDKKEINDFLAGLDLDSNHLPESGQYRERFKRILSNVHPYENSFVARQCVPIINTTTCYADNQQSVNKYIERYQEGRVAIKGSRVRLVDLDFADDCVTCISFAHLEQEEIEVFCREISRILLELMSFIEDLVLSFMKMRGV